MEKFEVINSLEDDVAVMNIRGFLDAHTAPLFEQELQKRVSEKKYKIVVDLEGLQYISSGVRFVRFSQPFRIYRKPSRRGCQIQ